MAIVDHGRGLQGLFCNPVACSNSHGIEFAKNPGPPVSRAVKLMAGISEFFAMGGYAGFIWPAFGIVLTVMATLWISSLRGWRESERTLEALRKNRRNRECIDE